MSDQLPEMPQGRMTQERKGGQYLLDEHGTLIAHTYTGKPEDASPDIPEANDTKQEVQPAPAEHVGE